MYPHLKARVQCVDGIVGEVTDVVVNHTAKQLTHLVVRHNGDERLIPMEDVTLHPGNVVHLNRSSWEFSRYPKFDRPLYKQVDPQEIDPHLELTSGHALTSIPESDRDVSRRKFFVWATGGIVALIGAGIAIPGVRYLIYPMYQGFNNQWIKIGRREQILKEDTPELLKFLKVNKEAYLVNTVEKTHWVVKASERLRKEIYSREENRIFREKDGSLVWENDPRVPLIVYSGKCPHLGCAFRWGEEKRQFLCPCHLSVFTLNGAVMGGPAPRPLDVLPVRIENGDVEIIDSEFKAGTHEKIRIA